jgi:hypothetical protein
MDFECCFGTSVPIFAGNTVVPRRDPAKHGDDPTPYERSEARDLPTNIGLDPLRTRSVRRASGLLETAFAEIGPADGPAPSSLPQPDFLPRIALKAIGDRAAMHTFQSPRLYRQILYQSRRCFCSRAPWAVQPSTGADHPQSVSKHHPSHITSGWA